jgi:hypothetical protein
MLRKVHINDRNYDNWKWFDGFSLEPTICDLNPLNIKLFTEDIIEINDDNTINIVHSSVRQMASMPGILVLTNKTFGRIKNKLIYKCIPDDKRLPVFLIPYDNTKDGFNKHPIDLYVTFAFVKWDKTDKHPIGRITNNLGTVDKLNNFYEYQLYCKSLYASIQDFTKTTISALKQKTEDEFINAIMEKNPKIIDRTQSHNVFSIDPLKSLDYDDAFCINQSECSDGIKTINISIYIANVAVWMEELNLWNSFSQRISTIYLPDRKRPMLPNILSDCLCSLQENRKRFAYCLDLTIRDNLITNMEINNCLIRVYKNYRYEETELLNDINYKTLFGCLQEVCKEKKLMQSVKDSHDVVGYLMILINSFCATKMIEHQNGIFRSVILNNKIVIPNHLPEDVGKFLQIWCSSSGQYSSFSENQGHSLVSEGLDSYIHISSPIRRLVDLLNSIKLQLNLGILQLGPNAIDFYDKWLGRLEYINTTMRAVRKIQSDCTLLELISKNPDINNITYDGIVFDKIRRNDALYQYMVYLYKLKMVSKITVRMDIPNFDKRGFKIFVFNDESTLKKKIRLQMIE